MGEIIITTSMSRFSIHEERRIKEINERRQKQNKIIKEAIKKTERAMNEL